MIGDQTASSNQRLPNEFELVHIILFKNIDKYPSL